MQNRKKSKTRETVRGNVWNSRTRIPGLDETEGELGFSRWSDRPPTAAQRDALEALGYTGGCQTADEAAAILEAFSTSFKAQKNPAS